MSFSLFFYLAKKLCSLLEVVVLRCGSHSLGGFFSVTLLPPPLQLPVLSISSLFLQ